MQRKRPTAVLIIAIFHFIGAGWGMIAFLIGCVQLVVKTIQAQAAAPTEPYARVAFVVEQRLRTQVPFWSAYEIGDLVADAAFSALLLLAGIGLLRMQRWGRTASISYGVLKIIHCIANLVFLLVFVVPVINSGMEEIVRSLPQVRGQDVQGFVSFMNIFVPLAYVVLPLLMMIYPFIVLVVMLWPSVARAFKEPAVSERPPGEEDFDSFERERHYGAGYE